MMRLCIQTRLVLFAVTALVIGAPAGVLGRDHRDLVPSYTPLRPVVKPAAVRINPEAPPGDLVVKFRRGTVIGSAASRTGGPGAERVRGIVSTAGLPPLEPMIAEPPAMIRARRIQAEDRVRMNLPDLALYFRTPVDNPALTERVLRELNALDEVELAYFEPRPEVAVYSREYSTPMSATAPFDWSANQTYLDAATDGVNAYAAWTLPGGDGTGIQIIDIEYGWQFTHEDLSQGGSAVIIGGNSTDNDHGTAVMGEMAADNDGFGMTGIVPQADLGGASVGWLSTASALYQSTAASTPGDLILIELHAPGPRYNFQSRADQQGYIAMEYWQSNFDAIVNAYANGVIVCEAAGNGGENFDDPIYDSVFTREFRNSHAIICGAGYPPAGGGGVDRSRIGFSNYGTRVDLQGYGTAVYSLGYGDLYNGGTKDSWYTGSFGGTSSASPIVTGAVAALSGVFKQMLGQTLDADSARNLLYTYGSPQQQPGLSQHIGPRPNLVPALGVLFDPVDSIWYGDIELEIGTDAALPVSLSNSHPIRDIYLPFLLTGPAPIFIDSLTLGPRTQNFASVAVSYDNRFLGEIAFTLRADLGNGTTYLAAGSGVVANLWVHTSPAASHGQVEIVDSAWLGSTNRLRLVSHFDDGYPDDFTPGSITILGCQCPNQGDLDASGGIDAVDMGALIDIVFFSEPDVQDASCPMFRSDLDCSSYSDAVDLGVMIDHVFFSSPPPCDPCQ